MELEKIADNIIKYMPRFTEACLHKGSQEEPQKEDEPLIQRKLDSIESIQRLSYSEFCSILSREPKKVIPVKDPFKIKGQLTSNSVIDLGNALKYLVGNAYGFEFNTRERVSSEGERKIDAFRTEYCSEKSQVSIYTDKGFLVEFAGFLPNESIFSLEIVSEMPRELAQRLDSGGNYLQFTPHCPMVSKRYYIEEDRNGSGEFKISGPK
jgi:hypothetical protein